MNQTAISAIMCVVIFIEVGCHGRSSTAAQPSSEGEKSAKHSSMKALVDPDAYAVYEAVLGNPSQGGAGAPLEPIAIESQTKVRELCFDPSVQRDPQMRDAATNYIRQNSEPEFLNADELNLGRKVELISSSEMGDTFSKGVMAGWETFHKKHPTLKGTVELSAVGFSADKNFAVVYSAVHCGPKCGAGGIVTLAKKNGVWLKKGDRLCSWIS